MTSTTGDQPAPTFGRELCVHDEPHDWRKSTYSGGGNDCVEVGTIRNGVAMRDSKNPAAGHLALTADDWTALLEAARHGELDLPAS